MNCTKTRHVFIGADLTVDQDIPKDTRCQCGRYQWGEMFLHPSWTKDVDIVMRDAPP